MAGSMVLTSGALVAGASSTGAPGSVTSGPFGKGAVNLSGGTLTSNASGYTIANQLYLGVSGSSVTLGDTNSYAMTLSGALGLWQNMTLTTPGSGVTLAGAISDGGSGYGITKSGAGTLTLSGASTYTGATTISQGTLQLGDGSSQQRFGLGQYHRQCHADLRQPQRPDLQRRDQWHRHFDQDRRRYGNSFQRQQLLRRHDRSAKARCNWATAAPTTARSRAILPTTPRWPSPTPTSKTTAASLAATAQ